MKTGALTILALLGLCPPCLAAPADDKVLAVCLDKAKTTYDMDQCFGAAMKRRDAELTKTLNMIRPHLDAKEQALLSAAQTAWIAYREAQCRAVEDLYRGGTIAPIQYGSCVEGVTRDRIDELRADHHDELNNLK